MENSNKDDIWGTDWDIDDENSMRCMIEKGVQNENIIMFFMNEGRTRQAVISKKNRMKKDMDQHYLQFIKQQLIGLVIQLQEVWNIMYLENEKSK